MLANKPKCATLVISDGNCVTRNTPSRQAPGIWVPNTSSASSTASTTKAACRDNFIDKRTTSPRKISAKNYAFDSSATKSASNLVSNVSVSMCSCACRNPAAPRRSRNAGFAASRCTAFAMATGSSGGTTKPQNLTTVANSVPWWAVRAGAAGQP